MRLTTAILAPLILLATIATSVLAADTHAEWQRIEVPTQFEDDQGIPRTPSCSGGPRLIQTEGGPVLTPAETQFSFFMRAGDPARLLINWDGGGACWDSHTCIGSALTETPVYDLGINETPERLAALGGISDLDNPRNPLRGHTQVFIPYCTGDLHFGSRETLYDLPSGGQWPIRHHGHDNVLAVLDSLRDYYDEIGREPEEIILVGVSAGGYGVLYNYRAVSETFPWTHKVRVLVDSANGIITDDLYRRALTPNGVWGLWENIDPVLENAFASGPETLMIETFRELGWQHPNARFGQYSSALDSTQILFYNLAKHLNEPTLWVDPNALFVSGLEWTFKAQSTMWWTAVTTWNYRFYLGQGVDHTLLGNARFYEESSARGVRFSDWFSDMIDQRWVFRSQWKNLSCAPDCVRDLWHF